MNNSVKFKDNCVNPVCPLELIKVATLSLNGCCTYSLQLACVQTLQFNHTGLVGKNLTLVVPNIFKDRDNKGLYQILKPSVEDIVIKTCTGETVEPTIIEVSTKSAIYILIPVTENMYVDCTLTLEFNRLTLPLKRTSSRRVECGEGGEDMLWYWTCAALSPDNDPCDDEESVPPASICESSPNLDCNCPTDCRGATNGKIRSSAKHWGTLQTLFNSRVFK